MISGMSFQYAVRCEIKLIIGGFEILFCCLDYTKGVAHLWVVWSSIDQILSFSYLFFSFLILLFSMKFLQISENTKRTLKGDHFPSLFLFIFSTDWKFNKEKATQIGGTTPLLWTFHDSTKNSAEILRFNSQVFQWKAYERTETSEYIKQQKPLWKKAVKLHFSKSHRLLYKINLWLTYRDATSQCRSSLWIWIANEERLSVFGIL